MVLREIRRQTHKALLIWRGNLQVSDHAGGNAGGGASNDGNVGFAMAILMADGGAHFGAALESTENGGDKAGAGEDLGNLHYEPGMCVSAEWMKLNAPVQKLDDGARKRTRLM